MNVVYHFGGGQPLHQYTKAIKRVTT